MTVRAGETDIAPPQPPAWTVDPLVYPPSLARDSGLETLGTSKCGPATSFPGCRGSAGS